MKRACVLVSGGVDSTALLKRSLTRYTDVTPLYVRCGMTWEEAELECLSKVMRQLKCSCLRELVVLEQAAQGLESHWSQTGWGVPGKYAGDEAVYIPGRNTVLLTQGCRYAQQHSIDVVEIGLLKSNPFRDGTPEFLEDFAKEFSRSHHASIKVIAPFHQWNKKRVVRGINPNLLRDTFSCINPRGMGPCNTCQKCFERQIVFEINDYSGMKQ